MSRSKSKDKVFFRSKNLRSTGAIQSVFTWRHSGHVGVPNQTPGEVPDHVSEKHSILNWEK